MADTDVLIDFLAGREPAAEHVAVEIGRGRLRTTAISRFELLCGARNPRQESAIRQLLNTVPTLPLDEDAADRAARVQRELERAGQTLGMADSLIAGIALGHGGALLTRNRRHFERVAGLDLVAFG
ncbi:MAG: type II toxin-antitoxin system VapC family toxin [Acidobacteriota bacterium]